MSRGIPIYVHCAFAYLQGIHHEKYGVAWHTQSAGDDTIRFSSFHRFNGEKGNGAKALKEVCDLADTYGVKVTLYTEFPKLVPFYEKFGFVKDTKRSSSHNTEFFRNPSPKHWEPEKHLSNSDFYKSVNRCKAEPECLTQPCNLCG